MSAANDAAGVREEDLPVVSVLRYTPLRTTMILTPDEEVPVVKGVSLEVRRARCVR